jgi:outer membrane cobalamin receptor
MRLLSSIFLILVSLGAWAQQRITGTVSDRRGNPVLYANIYLDGSYDGTTTDTSGAFTLNTALTGSQVLVASFIGYEKGMIEVDLDTLRRPLAITLKEAVSELNEVVITAGIFSASDEKKSATLSSYDIASTASAVGDIYGAYATMPGSQKVGEAGMLFVRGGESYETKTYMDGMLVQSPYFSSMPDVPTRGRFSPLLFSETLFSTGGYSAEYGHALSSIVDLSTNGLEAEDKASVAIMSVGANASWAKRWEKSSLAVTGLYANSTLTHLIFKPYVDWTKVPVLGDGMLMFRQQIGEKGLLKAFASFNAMRMGMNYDNFEAGTIVDMKLDNLNFYANTSYTDQLSEKWLIRTGVAFSRDGEKINYAGIPVNTVTTGASMKLTFTHLTSKNVKTRLGGDLNRGLYTQSVTDLSDNNFIMEMQDNQPSFFLETEWTLSKKLALRTGLRAEYSSLLGDAALLPRLSAAYKTGIYSQVSLAWGLYRQKPENEYLQFEPRLSHEKADHYILNFQYRKNRRTFRVEGYLKYYDDLVKYATPYSPLASDYNNDGYGRAQGIDFFWRDSESLDGSDYWISYSFLNTSRDYRDYPESVMPSFASAHNLSVVYKRFFEKLKILGGITYSFASGRPYHDPNSPVFMDGRTRAYNDISLNLTYLTALFRRDFIIHLNITNLLGFDHVFGYSYAGTPDESGTYPSQAIVPATGTMAVFMFMLSL